MAINETPCEGATLFHVVPSVLPALKPYDDDNPAFTNAPDGGYTDVVVTFQGKHDVATVLEAIHVHVIARDKPAGVAYDNGAGECGGVTPAFFSVNLDHAHPQAVATAVIDADGAVVSARRPFPFKITSTDPEVFHIYGGARECDCRWDVDVDWSSQGRSGTAKINNNGEPFRTVGMHGIPVYDISNDSTTWVQLTGPPDSPVH